MPRNALLLVGSMLILATAAEDCVDEHSACENWATSGECDRNPGFMHTACPRSCKTCPAPVDPKLTELGEERVNVAIDGYGEIVLGFYPNAAPITVAHIKKLFKLGCYDTNHIFRVDKGFVAQIQSVDASSVTKPLSEACKEEAKKTVPAEFTPIRHVRGILSMGRMSDPDSGGSSFSMLLGRAAHLDQQYTVFGKVLSGDDVLAKLEQVETRKEGIFVMPKSRITIDHADVHDKMEL
jgi:cyclophilin family peptidyl-prolyl cis-trans isomerase